MKVVPKFNLKLSVIAFVGVLIGTSFYIYHKLFGGKIELIDKNEYLVGKSEDKIATKPSSGFEIKELDVKEEKVAVAYADTPALGIQKVIAKTGGLDFIKPGQKVLVKPNVNSDDMAPGTAHPEAVAEIVKLAKSKGAYVIVGDRSNPRWNTITAMKKIGLYDAVEKAGADEIVGFEDLDWVRVKPEETKYWPKGFRVPKMLEKVDHIISVPVLHTHSITGYSLGIKNLVGLIHASDRMIFHASVNIEEMIAEISLAVKPSLTVIEGTKAFITGGPSKGTLTEPKVYLASKDIVASDIVGVELLKKHGAKFDFLNPLESELIKSGLDIGLNLYPAKDVLEELKDKI